jgi:alkylhydroperoxidase/carboxymuconolactone decarboxylase family protein YurZ
MSDSFTQQADAVLAGLAMIREGAPEAAKAFGALSMAATASKTLDTKTLRRA